MGVAPWPDAGMRNTRNSLAGASGYDDFFGQSRLGRGSQTFNINGMTLQTLLGNLSKQQFAEQYFHRFPFSSAGTARSLLELGTWEILETIISQPNVDVMVAREGRQFGGSPPTNLEQAQQLIREGYTVLIRHAERHAAPLLQLSREFALEFGGAVDIHIYATPAGQHGFGWHFDAEDVFIIQTAGSKEYSLRKNTVHPWPLVETIADDMGYPREIMPLMRVRLEAGDWLYIPCGYWHKAESCGAAETAISLALGVLSPAAIDILDFVRQRLVQSLVWRQRLPIRGAASGLTPEERESRYRELFQSLADDLALTFKDDAVVRAFLERESS